MFVKTVKLGWTLGLFQSPVYFFSAAFGDSDSFVHYLGETKCTPLQGRSKTPNVEAQLGQEKVLESCSAQHFPWYPAPALH